VVAIQPQVSGQVTEIHFKDGADLKKGQPLFTIDPRPYEAALAQTKAQLAQAKAQLELAKIEFNRVKDLPRSVEPQEDYDAKNNAIDVAAATVAANTAAVETAQINVQFCSINSPIDGRAGQRLVDLGNIVNSNTVGIASTTVGTASGSTLLMIQGLDPMYADFTIDQGKLSEVRARMAGGTLRTMVRLPEDHDWHTGSLTFLDNSVQDGSGTIKLRATLENKDHHFWPGQFVNVRLVLTMLKDAVLVSSSVPQMSQQGPYVLVVKEGTDKGGKPATIAEMRPVKLGQVHGDRIVLESGVKAGEQVITDGQMMVQPGGPVKVLPPPTSKPIAVRPAIPDEAEAQQALNEGTK
jgi:multidrug efflux system membrane fusion protein